MRDVDKRGIAAVIKECIDSVDPNGNRPLHLSLDIDAIDPVYAPGTGTLARGGLTYREIHYICEEMFESGRLVSMDLVELNPALDKRNAVEMHGDNPAFTSATETTRLCVELILSALGKTVLRHCPKKRRK